MRQIMQGLVREEDDWALAHNDSQPYFSHERKETSDAFPGERSFRIEKQSDKGRRETVRGLRRFIERNPTAIRAKEVLRRLEETLDTSKE